MRTPTPLPATLASVFAVAQGRLDGLSPRRLRAPDLAAPFHGVRTRTNANEPDFADDPWERQRQQRVAHAREYAPLLRPGTFFSHETAAALHGAPIPYELHNGVITDGRDLSVHVSVLGDGPIPRGAGVRGHRADPQTSAVVSLGGIRIANAATTWASLGATLRVPDLIAVGDFFCRVWREGVGRPHAGRPPIATRAELRAALTSGRRLGNPKLREAFDYIREDSWSPRESHLRYLLVSAGLPEPELNADVHSRTGRFIGCFDLVWRKHKLAADYHGQQHAAQYSSDVERGSRLRAEPGWRYLEVTSESMRIEAMLVQRFLRMLRIG